MVHGVIAPRTICSLCSLSTLLWTRTWEVAGKSGQVNPQERSVDAAWGHGEHLNVAVTPGWAGSNQDSDTED